MRLDFSRFLTESQKSNFLIDNPVICFTGSEYSLLFFSQLRIFIERTMTVEIIDVSQENEQMLMSRLSTTFLGNRLAFIIKGLESDGRGKDKKIISYLDTYVGPHMLCVYLSPDQYGEQDRSFLTVTLPEYVDRDMFLQLMSWSGRQITASVKQSVKQLFELYTQISLEHACLLLFYMPLGAIDREFFDTWLPILVTSEHSMFTLSQYLFQKESAHFFMQWKKIADAYSPQFWVTFWSEQLWRASMFIQLSKQRKFNDARKIAFRLPFSFINRDWRRYTVADLAAAHDTLYRLDYRCKIIENSVGLDLFYARFLSQ